MRLRAEVIVGDCIESMRSMPESSVQCCVTSPPYWGLRDYGHDGQIGLEETPDAYVERMVEVFSEVRRVLRDDGTLWLNLGDSYANNGVQGPNSGLALLADKYAPRANQRKPNRDDVGEVPRVKKTVPSTLKPKDLVGIPWRVAFALQADGWWLRQDIIWHKPNPMPESVTDRCTKAHEYLFLLSKSPRYYYDAEAVKEFAKYPFDNRGARKDARRGTECNSMSGATSEFRNKRSVWDLASDISDTVDEIACYAEENDGVVNRDKIADVIEKVVGVGGSVWRLATQPYKGAHFAVMPPKLVEPCIKAGCPEGGTVLDPFAGSGTTLAVALNLGRHAVGCELNADYAKLAEERIAAVRDKTALFDEVAG